jgi:hypothetical protein
MNQKLAGYRRESWIRVEIRQRNEARLARKMLHFLIKNHFFALSIKALKRAHGRFIHAKRSVVLADKVVPGGIFICCIRF